MCCWSGFLMSEQLIQYCQWKCLELSLEINLDTFSNYSLVGAGSMGEVYRVIKKDTNKTFGLALSKRNLQHCRTEIPKIFYS